MNETIIREFIRYTLSEGGQDQSPQSAQAAVNSKENSMVSYVKEVQKHLTTYSYDILQIVDTWSGYRANPDNIKHLKRVLRNAIAVDTKERDLGIGDNVLPLTLVVTCLTIQQAWETVAQNLMGHFENLTGIPTLSTTKDLDNRPYDPDGSAADAVSYYKFARRKSREMFPDDQKKKYPPDVQRKLELTQTFEDYWNTGVITLLVLAAGLVFDPAAAIIAAIGAAIGLTAAELAIACLAIGLLLALSAMFNSLSDLLTDPKLVGADASNIASLMRSDALSKSSAALEYVSAAFRDHGSPVSLKIEKKMKDIATDLKNKKLPARASLNELKTLLSEDDSTIGN